MPIKNLSSSILKFKFKFKVNVRTLAVCSLVTLALSGCNTIETAPQERSDYVSNSDLMTRNGVPIAISNALTSVGLNTIETWVSCDVPSMRHARAQYEKVTSDNWAHFVFIECIDESFGVFQGPEPEVGRLNKLVTRTRAQALAKRVRLFKDQYPEVAVGNSIKDRFPIGGWEAQGRTYGHVDKAMETRPEIFSDFLEMLDIYAAELAKVDHPALYITPLNEPEYWSTADSKDLL